MKGRPKRFLFWMKTCPLYVLRQGYDSGFVPVHPAAERCFPPSPVFVPLALTTSLVPRWSLELIQLKATSSSPVVFSWFTHPTHPPALFPDLVSSTDMVAEGDAGEEGPNPQINNEGTERGKD